MKYHVGQGEQSHVNEYTLGCLRASKMADRCANTVATQILYLLEKAVLQKTLVLNQAIAMLWRSLGLPGRFVTVWTHTQLL